MKRLLDLVIALVASLALLPIIAIVALAIRISLGGPVFFRQERPGMNGTPFMMVKFRTMSNALGPDGAPLPDADRLTPFGKFLRSTSLDELPELWNVIVGDMSLVGPRPLLMDYLPLYSPEQARRHEVRPGITGWAQINGRNSLSWNEKFALDIWYVDNRSVVLDIKILFLTLRKVIARDGISADGEVTMPPFEGSPDVKMSGASDHTSRDR
ncbi:MAG: sugar transferase [Tsuneonella suprasediminis]|nr:sugar transferase [Altererythrobacter sp. N1]